MTWTLEKILKQFFPEHEISRCEQRLGYYIFISDSELIGVRDMAAAWIREPEQKGIENDDN